MMCKHSKCFKSENRLDFLIVSNRDHLLMGRKVIHELMDKRLFSLGAFTFIVAQLRLLHFLQLFKHVKARAKLIKTTPVPTLNDATVFKDMDYVGAADS